MRLRLSRHPLYLNQASVDHAGPDPAVELAARIANEETSLGNRLHEVKVVSTANGTQHDVTDTQRLPRRLDRAKLTTPNLGFHAVATGNSDTPRRA